MKTPQGFSRMGASLYRPQWRDVVRSESPRRRPCRWLIIAAGDPALSDRLGEALRAGGDTCVVVGLSGAAGTEGRAGVERDGAGEADALRAHVERCCAEAEFNAVLWFPPSEARPDDAEVPIATLVNPCAQAVALADLTLRGAIRRLLFVTRGALAFDRPLRNVNVSGAALAGLIPWINARAQAPRAGLVDLPASPTQVELDALVDEVRADDVRQLVAIRGDLRREEFLESVADPRGHNRLPPEGTPVLAVKSEFCLKVAEVEGDAPLELRAIDRGPVAPGDVEVETIVTSLCPLDGPVSGRASSRSAGKGFACAGRVSRLGEGVRGGLRVGELVVALASGSMGRHVSAPAALVVPTHGGMDPARAATQAIGAVAARLALDEVARVRRGDNVLVLGAGSFLGLACVRYARHLGASVAVEEPDLRSRDWAMTHGCPRVLSANSPTFREDLLQTPRGDRVRVVINCGADVPRDLPAMTATGAIYVHFGATPDPGSLPNVAVHRTDLADLFEKHPQACSRLLHAATTEPGSEQWPDVDRIPIERAIETLRLADPALRRACVDWTGADAALVNPKTTSRSGIRAEATYLIVGGTGRIGRLVARWLVAQRAGHLALVGLHEPGMETNLEVNFLRRAGADIRCFQADVGSDRAVREVVRSIEATMPHIAGVFYLAGRTENAVPLAADAFLQVATSRIGGVRNIVAATRDILLDFFVCLGLAATDPSCGPVQSMVDSAVEALVQSGIGPRSSFVRFPVLARKDTDERTLFVAPEDRTRIPPSVGCAAFGRILRGLWGSSVLFADAPFDPASHASKAELESARAEAIPSPQ